jgi:hypothetical protein
METLLRPPPLPLFCLSTMMPLFPGLFVSGKRNTDTRTSAFDEKSRLSGDELLLMNEKEQRGKRIPDSCSSITSSFEMQFVSLFSAKTFS